MKKARHNTGTFISILFLFKYCKTKRQDIGNLLKCLYLASRQNYVKQIILFHFTYDYINSIASRNNS